MSQQARAVVSFKLDKEQKDFIDNVINNISKLKTIEKGDVLYLMVKHYIDTINKSDENNSSDIKPFDCNFLNCKDGYWYCLETMATTKKPIELGGDIKEVNIRCQACFDKNQIIENERKRKLLERDNIRNLIKFYRDFLQLTKGGFDVSVTMCKGNLLEKSSMIFSRDGEVLFCPLQEMNLVVINEVCKEITNDMVKKTKGCKYLISVEHHVNYKGSKTEENIKQILPQLNKLEDEKEEL